ncbi:hypothetical protein QFC20_002192 [Naganishia adeliensis]|uniref:Uncharacterized protein n=1 Tax=Naganishia adeliensis TaxID=92952 RepID=A0ACC2WKY2_9TREE|nr:hypothetical protein QFC20_002192 [Naganishia adeliensis]
MSQTNEFFCQACGRHTSHAAEKRKQASTHGKPSVEIVEGWKRLLDEAGKGGKWTAVTCSEVQRKVFEEPIGEGSQGTNGATQRLDDISGPEDNQRLGMKKAKDREDTRRAARLLYHFGFQHFAPRPPSSAPDTSTTSPAKDRKSERGAATSNKHEDGFRLEAVQNGKVIQDVTHAKGEWGLRYRRD